LRWGDTELAQFAPKAPDKWGEDVPNMPKRNRPMSRSNGIIKEHGIEVISLEAAYLDHGGRRALIMDGSQSCSVEEYACRYFDRTGYRAVLLENKPIHVLFATFMWPVLQDAADKRSGMFGFVDREAYDAGIKGKLIWFRLPSDFGKPEYAKRRAKHIDKHITALPAQSQELRQLFDEWLSPSRDLRNYLWAHRPEHVEVARQLIDVLPPAMLIEVLRYLVEHYWGRYTGWPDLLLYRQNQYMLVEVKSAADNLGAAQQRWIRDNRERLRLPFKLLKIAAKSVPAARSVAAT
jgi:hypothetical protein